MKYCFDATALVVYITDDTVSKDIERIMVNIEKGKYEGILSVVNLAEFHRAMTRIISEEKADKYVTWLRESRLYIVTPSVETACLASIKKQKYASSKEPFAWGDAFCLATAMEHEADYIITTDSEFRNVKEIPIIGL